MRGRQMIFREVYHRSLYQSLLKVLGILLLLCMLALCLCACTETAPPEGEKFNVQYSAGIGGKIEGITHQTVLAGENSEMVKAIPNDGHIFVKWSDGVTEDMRTDRKVTANISVTAIFEKVKFTIEYAAGEYGKIEGELHQQVAYREYGAKVTAVPDIGCRFVSWSDGETQASREDFCSDSGLKISAYFERCYTVGSGTKEDPFQITSYVEFKNVAYFPAAYFRLMCNLDLSGYNHEPLFSDETGFLGCFDGYGYTIQNMMVNSSSQCPSLFGVVGAGGVIRNLHLEEFHIKFRNSEASFNTFAAGAIAGISYGELENICVDGKLDVKDIFHNKVYIGGLVGFLGGNILNCHAEVDIELNDLQSSNLQSDVNIKAFCVGGLSGAGQGSIINNCSVTGEIDVLSSKRLIYIGGLIGQYANNCDHGSTIINNNKTNINIMSPNQLAQAGGFMCLFEVTQTARTVVKDCITKGKIESYAASGFIHDATIYGEGVIQNCRAESEMIVSGNGAGFLSQSLGGSIFDCRAAGKISANGNGLVAGFGLNYFKTKFLRCCYSGDIEAKRAFGFVHRVNKCSLEQCCVLGKVVAVIHGSGFGFIISESVIQDSFSKSNVYNVNVDENSGRTMAAGFAIAIEDSQIKNCYYYGDIKGTVYAQSTGLPIIGAFVGIIIDESIFINCHVLHRDKTFIANIVGENRNDKDVLLDITAYIYEKEMFFLADKLNRDGMAIFYNQEKSPPTFLWMVD